jgi:hypothetical protein
VVQSLDHQPKRPSAVARATAAWHTAQIYRIVLVPGQFLTRPNLPSARQENATAGLSFREIWIAAMVSELSAAAPHSAVYKIAGLHLRDIYISGELQSRRLPQLSFWPLYSITTRFAGISSSA